MAVGSAMRSETLTPPPVDQPATRDIPLPSRRLRIGLGSEPLDSAVSTAEIPVAADDVPATQGAAVQSGPKPTSGGRHRLAAPSSALKARTALVAMAAGAGAFALAGPSIDQAKPAPEPVPEPQVASDVALAASGTGDDLGPGVAASVPESDMSVFDDQLPQGTKIAKKKEAARQAALKPEVMSPLPMGTYDLTSAFAPRWGAFHGGIDLAAPLGTPIHAATDGVVIEAGPASGYGNWVQIKAPDGTITMYGHMSSSGVQVKQGQKVTAGDIIALVGSEGFSTGPHCHFEVWKDGKMKIDPAVWLAAKGVRLSALH
ncbi:M23 family metallopeptidase [Gordonia sp. HY442]|uniref:M23 family metallopeptidase n=1 Tax=Gordonia zhenghanii TaxID=2911516 RepID=UPI001F3F6C52|nr:M23 family metallopeptidase [Gordonia zhenghanii]MCF8607097.1 M23 family metallopeptidase [Gordonia zhenghanii]